MWHALEPGEMHAGFWLGDLRKTNQLENLGVDGRIILKCMFEELNDIKDWIDLAQERNRWRALGNAVINFGVE